MRFVNPVTLFALILVVGCAGDQAEQLATMSARISELTEKVEQLEAAQAEPALPPKVNAEPERLAVRELVIVDENDVERIKLSAGVAGSQITLSDHERRRILITAREPLADVGDISGIVLQANGQAIAWQTPPVK